jgi:hypothetical protein
LAKRTSLSFSVGRLDRVASQSHLALRAEYVQKHSDVLTRHSGAKSRATCKQAGNNPHPVTSLEAALLWQGNRSSPL